MANKLILGSGIIASLYLLGRKDTPTVPNTTTIVAAPIAPSGPTMAPSGDSGILGINGPENEIRADTPPSNEWTRAEWSAWYKANIEQDGLSIATQLLWDKFNNEENPALVLFPSQEALAFDLLLKNANYTIGETLTADSTPIYGTMYSWWNNLEYWNCQKWQQWYDLNALKYGAQTAKNKFVDAWSHPDNHELWGWESMGIMCGYDCDFINYFRTKGIDVAKFGAVNTCTLVEIPSDLIDATAATTEGVKNTAKAVGFIMPVVVIGAATLFLYGQYQKNK